MFSCMRVRLIYALNYYLLTYLLSRRDESRCDAVRVLTVQVWWMLELLTLNWRHRRRRQNTCSWHHRLRHRWTRHHHQLTWPTTPPSSSPSARDPYLSLHPSPAGADYILAPVLLLLFEACWKRQSICPSSNRWRWYFDLHHFTDNFLFYCLTHSGRLTAIMLVHKLLLQEWIVAFGTAAARGLIGEAMPVHTGP